MMIRINGRKIRVNGVIYFFNIFHLKGSIYGYSKPRMKKDDLDETFIGKILNNVRKLHSRNKHIHYQIRTPPRSAPHPRRSLMYKPFVVIDDDIFFKLRARGVPILTSYFLSDFTNRNRLYTRLQFLEKDRAIYMLKNLY